MRVGVLVGLLATLSGVAVAQQDEERTREFSQSPAVLARYADVPVKLDAPGLAPGRDTYTSQDEMMAFLKRLKERVPRTNLGSLGTSQQGRDIPISCSRPKAPRTRKRSRRSIGRWSG